MNKQLCDSIVALVSDARAISRWPRSSSDVAMGFYCIECLRTSGDSAASALLSEISVSEYSNSVEIQHAIKRHQRKLDSGDITPLPINDVAQFPPLSLEQSPNFAANIPPLRERILTFASSALRHAVDGFQRCETSEIENRLSICRECPNLVNDHCIVCGCACVPDAYLSKVAWRSEKCPEGKW